MNIVNFLVCLILALAVSYLYSYLEDNKTSITIKNIFIVLVTAFAININYMYTSNSLKIINTLIILVFSLKFFNNVKVKQSFFTAFFIEIFVVLSETLFTVAVILFNEKSVEYFVNNYFGSLLSNIVILVIAILLIRNNKCKRLYLIVKSFYYRVNNDILFVIYFASIFIYNIYAVQFYFGLNNYILLLFSISLSFIFLFFVIFYILDKIKYIDMINKYNGNLSTLKELEKLVDNFRISNHENKNRLLTIKNMTTNKKVNSYIESIVNVNMNNDNLIIKDVSAIPSGGLKGLICSKLLKISNCNIEYELNIDRHLKVINFNDIPDKTILDMCDIISVYIDNSIEALEKIDDKYIIIDIYLEDEYLKICVTNPYIGIINDDIYKKGKSSKGKNRGFGLTLVKKIVKNNKDLKIQYDVTENEFTQYLLIKIKEN